MLEPHNSWKLYLSLHSSSLHSIIYTYFQTYAQWEPHRPGRWAMISPDEQWLVQQLRRDQASILGFQFLLHWQQETLNNFKQEERSSWGILKMRQHLISLSRDFSFRTSRKQFLHSCTILRWENKWTASSKILLRETTKQREIFLEIFLLFNIRPIVSPIFLANLFFQLVHHALQRVRSMS